MPELYIGLMSGTSLDGIDAALVDFSNGNIQLVEFAYLPFTEQLKAVIHDLSQADRLIALQDYGAMDSLLGEYFAKAVAELLAKSGYPATAITAIGSHGQTVFHAPDGKYPFSLQIGDPNLIAERTGITTVADFRRRDMACGGQGAPLVPAFHQAVFSSSEQPRCIVNIGGIANITILPANAAEPVIGFDTGPGNILMDQWINKHQQLPYDANGDWASSGISQADLLALWLQDSYFHALPPKSTGKEYFSLAWLENQGNIHNYSPADVQASLCSLTAISICSAIRAYAPDCQQVLVCGGGSHNTKLQQLLAENLPCPIASSADYGIHPDHVEAMAFAWLAQQTIKGLPGNLQEVTGAKLPAILGGIYQA